MFFRRSGPKSPTSPCRSCSRIRAFLAVSGLLIIALPFFGEKAAPIALLTPMTIALTLFWVGMIAFIARWISWRRKELRNQGPLNKSAEDIT